MPWISAFSGVSHGGRGGEAVGVLFHKDKAGGKTSDRFTIRCRLGLDAIKCCRYQVGDFLHLEFDPESRSVRVRRVTTSEKESGLGWKLIACNGKSEGGGALYFKAGRIDEKWVAVMFPKGSKRYQTEDYRFDNGLICKWPERNETSPRGPHDAA